MAFAGVTTLQQLHVDDDGALAVDRNADTATNRGVLSWHGCMDLRRSNLNMHQTQCRLHAALDLHEPCATEDVGVFVRERGSECSYIERDYAGNRLGGEYSLEEKWTNLLNPQDRRYLAVVRRVGWDGSVAGASGVRKGDLRFLSEQPPQDILRHDGETKDHRRVSMFIVVGDFWSFADCRCDGPRALETTNYITGRVRCGRHSVAQRHSAEDDPSAPAPTPTPAAKDPGQGQDKDKDMHMCFEVAHRIGAGVAACAAGTQSTSQHATYDTREEGSPMRGGFPAQTPTEENVSGLLFALPGEAQDYEVLTALTGTPTPTPSPTATAAPLASPAPCVDSAAELPNAGLPRAPPPCFQWPPAAEELPGLVFRGGNSAAPAGGQQW